MGNSYWVLYYFSLSQILQRLVILIISILTGLIIYGQNKSAGVDFTHVAPIIAHNCTPCHTGHQLGPMPLTTYNEVSSYGEMIKYLVEHKYMPPWLPDSEFSTFKHQRVLSAEEILLIKDWVSSGMNKGSIKEDESILTPIQADLNKPSVEICMDQSFMQYGIYKDQFQVFVLPINNKSALWVHDLQIKVGNNKILRSCKVAIGTSDKWVAMDNWDPRYGYYSFGGLGAIPEYKSWYTWSPFNPDESGLPRFLPPEAVLLLEMHYGPVGKPAYDRSCLSFDTSSFDQLKQPIHSAPLINLNNLTKEVDFIPANEITRLHASYELPYAIDIFTINPSANLICRSWEIFATLPSKEVVPILKISDWLVDWAEKYQLETPILLPKGTIIHALATYDNTSNNPHNPAYPPIDMKWGHGMFKERFEVMFDFQPHIYDNSSFHLAPLPTVTEGEDFNLFYHSNIKEAASIQVESLDSNEACITLDFIANHVTGMICIPTSTLARGNYLLKVIDSNGHLIAEDLLFILREKGFFR